MSPSLSFECWRSDEPAATDPLDRATWAMLRILVDGRCVTQFWDRQQRTEAQNLYVPTFTLARWLVANWWALLYEPCRSESPPLETDSWSVDQRQWLGRHCVRTADASLILPYFLLYHNGRSVVCYWEADAANEESRAPLQFVNRGLVQLEISDVEASLAEFVSKVLGWCSELSDVRVEQLRSDWLAITNADVEERTFCRAAGRLGLDPYALSEWEPGLSDLLSSDLGQRLDEPLVEDMLESVSPITIAPWWTWVAGAESALALAGRSIALPKPRTMQLPKDYGYYLAGKVRNEAGVNKIDPIDEVKLTAQKSMDIKIKLNNYNHVPGREVLAAVGWSDGNGLIAGPLPSRDESRRFLEARGTYQLIAACQNGPRLLTRAHTWDQQASRAFAAELLAPQDALAGHASPDMDVDDQADLINSLARRYCVSTEVIRLQLANSGAWRRSDD